MAGSYLERECRRKSLERHGMFTYKSKGGFMRKYCWLLLLVAAAISLLAAPVLAEELKVGDQAPSFSLPGSDGGTHELSKLKGKWVVLAWFPKAFTGG